MSTISKAERSSFELAWLDLTSEPALVAASARWYSILEEPGTTMPDRRSTTVFVGPASGVPDLCR